MKWIFNHLTCSNNSRIGLSDTFCGFLHHQMTLYFLSNLLHARPRLQKVKLCIVENKFLVQYGVLLLDNICVGVLNNCFITTEAGSTIWVSAPFILSQCKSKVLIFLPQPKHNQGTHTWVFLLRFAYHNKRHVFSQWQILVTSKYLFY